MGGGRRRAPRPIPRKRLEGMILPGDFDIPPGATPEQALKAVVSASAALWNGTDIIRDSAANGVTPYQAAIIASLVEREAITADMPKVSRVIYNRLAMPMKLEFDSTVNYALDRASIATTAADRANPSPYNTYAQPGPAADARSPRPGPDARRRRAEPRRRGRGCSSSRSNQEGESCFSDHRRAAQRVCRAGAGQRCLRLSRAPRSRLGAAAVHRAAVLGSPVSHSLSPALHRAGYAASGLTGWRYDAIECDARRAAGSGRPARGPEWAGFSVTMPGKAAAAAVADERERPGAHARGRQHPGPPGRRLVRREHRRGRDHRRACAPPAPGRPGPR